MEAHEGWSSHVWPVQILLITEVMQGGDLRKHIKADTARPRATGWHNQGRYIALGLVRGLVYLHEMGFIWFDCKPNNVLLDHTKAVAKIAVFGLAKILTTKTHTVGHMASPPDFLPISALSRLTPDNLDDHPMCQQGQ